MPTPPKQHSGASLENAVFYISLVALVVTVGTFFYLQQAVTKSNEEFASLSVEAAKSKTQDQKNLENGILKTQQELHDFSKLIAASKASSMLFSKVEDVLVSGVVLAKYDLDVVNMTASISGVADNFVALGQQVAQFQSEDAVFGDVSVGEVNISDDDDDKGGVVFSLKVKFRDGATAPQSGG